MKKIYNFMIVATFLSVLSACSPRVTTSVYKQYYPLNDTVPVRLFGYGEQPPELSEFLGTVTVTDNGFSIKCNYETVSALAIAETRRIGGNAFAVMEHRWPSLWGSTCHQIMGTALRLPSSDTIQSEKPVFKIEDSYEQVWLEEKRLHSASPFDLTLNIGYGIIYNRTKGLKGVEKKAEDELSNGLTWDITFHQYFDSNMGWGIMYSGYTSSAELFGVQNEIMLSYVAPQYSIKATWNKWELKSEVGLGYLRYYNRVSEMHNKGAIYGNTFGVNVGIGIGYKLSKYLGIGMDLSLIGGSLSELQYKNVIPSYEMSDDEQLGMSRINFMVGLRYYIK